MMITITIATVAVECPYSQSGATMRDTPVPGFLDPLFESQQQ